MMLRILLAAFVVATAGLAHGEIEKIAVPCEKGICLYWWPKLPRLPGWHGDRQNSLHYGINALAPDGFTFSDAQAIIYAKALYKPRVPHITSLEALIESDRSDFLRSRPGILIAEAPDLTNADGQRLKSFTYFPKERGNWERVAYGEEGDFFLVFTVSSRSLDSYPAAESAFETLVGQYREDLTDTSR
jgi:hypothetical protein